MFFNQTKLNVNRSCSLCCCWSCCFSSNSKCCNINNAWAPPLWHAKCGSAVVGVYLSQNVDVKPLEHLLILQWKTTMESKAQWEICMEIQGNSSSLHRKWRVLTGWFQAVRCSLCVDSCRKQQTHIIQRTKVGSVTGMHWSNQWLYAKSSNQSNPYYCWIGLCKSIDVYVLAFYLMNTSLTRVLWATQGTTLSWVIIIFPSIICI